MNEELTRKLGQDSVKWFYHMWDTYWKKEHPESKQILRASFMAGFDYGVHSYYQAEEKNDT